MPVGKYAKSALEKLGIWASVEKKFAMTDNVRAALALVARGEAVLGIVYETDAKVEKNVKIVGAFPADSHPADRLSGRRDRERQARGRGVSRVPAQRHRQGGVRAIRLHLPGAADVRRACSCSPSPPMNGPRSRSRCGSRSSRRSWRCRSRIAIAWVLARKDFWGKALLDGIVHLPLVLPPVVTGYLLLIWFGRRGVIGAFLADTFGIVFSFRWTGAALACGVMGFPLLVRAIRLSFEAVDAKLEDAAWTLGANRLLVFATVTLPLALPGIIAGMVLCFAKALGEFGATITFVSNIPGETQTISAAIYTYTQIPNARRRGRAAGRRRDRDLAGGAGRLRMARAPRRHALPRGVTCWRSMSRNSSGTSASRRSSRRPTA